jgi:hypothetical protein
MLLELRAEDGDGMVDDSVVFSPQFEQHRVLFRSLRAA